MKNTLLSLGVIAGLGAGDAGCAGAPPRSRAVAIGAGEPSTSSYVTPARWDFHPSTPTAALAGERLADGRCLFTAEGGARWVSETAKVTGNVLRCTGAAEASSTVAPDDLTTILHREGSWVFVTDGGDMHEAPEPLAPFSRSTTAPDPLARVAVAGASVVAATRAGTIARWDAVNGWGPGKVVPGLEKTHVFDVASGPNGRLLALGFPEALFVSEDEGRTFRAAGQPAIGARRLGLTPEGDVAAQGVFESEAWRPSSFAQSRDRVMNRAPALAVEVGRAASTSALEKTRAVFEGDRYYEVFRDEPLGEPWTFARGRLEGRLEVSKLPGTEPCVRLVIGARGSSVVVACARDRHDEDLAMSVDVRVSDDGGTSWSAPRTLPRLSTPDSVPIQIAVAGRSAVFVGVCKSDPRVACNPGAPLVLSRVAPGEAADTSEQAEARDVGDAGGVDAGGSGKGSYRFLPASAPQLTGSAHAPACSLDGRSVYVIGKRGKDEHFNIFVSHDGGSTFAPRPIVDPPREHEPKEEPNENERTPPGLQVDEQVTFRVGEDGTVGFVGLRDAATWVYVIADEDGRVLQVATPPLDAAGNALDVVYGGVGRRVIAAALNGTADGSALLESLDGGGTWTTLAMPPALVREYGSTLAIACSTGGCLLGDNLARVGWDGGGDGGAHASSSIPATPPAPGPSLPSIACELSPGSRWTRIEDVAPTPSGVGFPAAREMMRGRSVWSVGTRQPATGAIGVVEAVAPERGNGEASIVRHALLGPAPPRTATAMSPDDAEGYLAVRVTYTEDKEGRPTLSGPLRDLELSWTNIVEGASGRARSAEVGLAEAGDVTYVLANAPELHPSVLSVRSRGVYVQPHAASASRASIFADAAGKVERFDAPAFPRTSPVGDLEIRRDAAVVDREMLALAFAAQDGGGRRFTSVLTGKRATDGSFSLAALTLAPPEAPSAATYWTASRPVGLVTFFADSTNQRAWASFVQLRADGTFAAPEPAPTLADLGPRPRACTADDRARTPRVVQPRVIETAQVWEHAWPTVVVTERASKATPAPDAYTLTTNGVVLHGAAGGAGSACFSAWDAAIGGASPAGAAIPADMTRSWFFRLRFEERPTPSVPKKPRARAMRRVVEARPMSCHWDATKP